MSSRELGGISRRVLPKRAVFGAAALAVGPALAWGWWEREFPQVTVSYLQVLPAGCAPLRVLQVADPHLIAGQNRLVSYIRSLAELQPDLVVATGDNMSAQGALETVLEAFAPLLKVPGVFVFGSNDYYSSRRKSITRYLRRDPRRADSKKPPRERDLPWQELSAAFRKAGWLDLRNAAGALKITATGGIPVVHRLGADTAEVGAVTGTGASAEAGISAGAGAGMAASDDGHPGCLRTVLRVSFLGVDDPHLNIDRLPHPPAGWDEADLRLGLTHAPYQRVLTALAQLGTDLVFAGHTHGGQWCLPGYGALVTNCDLDRGRAAGLFQWPFPDPVSKDPLFTGESLAVPPGSGQTAVHVSRGLGTNPFTPLRFACRAEANLLHLLPKES